VARSRVVGAGRRAQARRDDERSAEGARQRDVRPLRRAPADVRRLPPPQRPACLLDRAKGSSTLVGYARDGFGIYVERDAHGALLTNAALDVCHGRTSVVLWNGRRQRMYHYDATLEYPYTVACYHGTPVR
jgi:hypothetical protein